MLFAVWLSMGTMLSGLLVGSADAQEGLQPGEVYVTRFSGTTTEGGRTVIDTVGTVGGIIDIRRPGALAQGQHWLNEPQSLSVTAAQVGQVFGVAFDDTSPANVYLSATSAFGLHRTPDNADWMSGMWGAMGGPGTVWKLDASNNYKPEVFADIKLAGRANTGAALGNIAYDKWNKQLYVSDLETGAIHRLGISDGRDLGTYDHGTQGRTSFIDVTTGARQSLPVVAFDAKTRARIKDCPDGGVASTPACWNMADFRRRVWGLGVRQDAATGGVRLYYAVWSSQGFGNTAFARAEDQAKRNSVWSVAIAQNGSFDAASVRREFFLPDFFTEKADIARAGRSNPVSDIAFPKTGDQNVMLLAERGGVRNLGLEARAPFARAHEARVLRYELDAKGVWRLAGRYDVGFYDRKRHGQPFIRAGSAGGVDFGFGYDGPGAVDTSQVDKFVWMTGDALCAPDGPCADPATGKHDDISEVHGLQGIPADAYDELAPDAALKPYPATGVPYPAKGPDKAYMIDVGRNVDTSGNVIAAEMARDDTTKVGDVEVYAAPVTATSPGYPMAGTPAYPSYTPGGGAPPGGAQPTLPPGPPPPGGPAPNLTILKTGPAQCTAPGTCAFDIMVKNVGSVTYTGPISVTDTLPGGWDIAGAGVGPNWTCTLKGQIGGGGQIDCGYPATNLAPAQSVGMKLTLKVPTGAKPGQVQNCADLSYTSGLDRSCVSIKVVGGKPLSKLDFELLKAAKPGQVTCKNNDTCTFRLTLTNRGATTYPDSPSHKLWIKDNLPSGWTMAGFGPTTKWKCTVSGAAITCEYLGAPLSSNASETVAITANVPPFETRTQVNNCADFKIYSQPGWIGGGLFDDDNPNNNRPCLPVKINVQKFGPNLPGDGSGVLLVPDLAIRKSGPAQCTRNATCKFNLTITNVGTDTYTGPITVQDKIFEFAGIKLTAWSAPWTCGETSLGSYKCSRPVATLAPNQSTTLALDFTFPPNLPKLLDFVRNCAMAEATSTTKATPWECYPVPVPKLPLPDLSIAKEVVGAGCDHQSCTFKITITNKNTEPYKGPIYIYDYLDGRPSRISSYDPKTDWACERTGFTPQGNAIFCLHTPVTLNQNESVSLTLDLRFPYSGYRQVKNCTGIRWPVANLQNKDSVFDSVMIALRLLGYYEGYKFDGSIPSAGPDPDLSKAINDYLQTQWNLTGDGKITPQLLDLLFPDSAAEAGDDYPANDGPVCIIALTPAEVEITGSTDWSVLLPWHWGYRFDSSGLPECWPPNCSYFEFTGTFLGPERYSGPMSMRIILPPDTDFPKLRVTKSGPACPTGGWSCQRTDEGYSCRHSACSIAPGEQIAIKVDGTLLPGMTEPPQSETTKTACAVLEWESPPYKGIDIEQLGTTKQSATTCFTTRIRRPPKLAATPQRPCPPAQRWDPAEQVCVPAPAPSPPEAEAKRPDLSMRKSAPSECRTPGNCVFDSIITNEGPGLYEGPLTILDSAPPEWELLGGFPSPPWLCTRAGATVKCRHERVELPSGKSVELHLEFLVPPINAPRREVENCMWVARQGSAEDRNEPSTQEIQERLNELGYEAGPVDGKIGRQSREAIRRYQERKGLPRTGGIDDALVKDLFPRSPAPPTDPNADNDRSCAKTVLVGPPEEERVRPPEPPAPEPQVEEERPRPPAVTAPPSGRRECPPGQKRNRAGQCVCPEGQRWDGARCVRREVACPPGQSRNRAGQCVCPEGQRWDGARCVRRAPPVQPPPKLQPIPACPLGTVWHAPSKKCIRPPG